MLILEVRKILKELNFDDAIIAEVLGLNLSQTSFHHKLSLNQICDLSNFLDITVTQLLNNTFDIDLLKKKFIAPSFAIPEEYLGYGGTFIDTIKKIADFVELMIPKLNSREQFLRNLQLTENTIRQPNLMLNANCLLKSGETLKNIFNFSKEDIMYMAIYLNKNAKRNKIQPLIKDCRFDSEVADIICSLTNSYYDKNFKYHVERKETKFKVVGISNPEINSFIGLPIICDEIFSYFKAYTITNTTELAFGRNMKLIGIENSIERQQQKQEFIFEESKLQ